MAAAQNQPLPAALYCLCAKPDGSAACVAGKVACDEECEFSGECVCSGQCSPDENQLRSQGQAPAASVKDSPASVSPSAVIAIPLPFGGGPGLASTAGSLIRNFTGLLGIGAFLMFLYGGWLYLTSQGEPEKVKKGQETLLWATFGLIVIFASYAGVRFVLEVALQKRS